MTQLRFAVPCLFGLEGLVGDELRKLKMQDVQVYLTRLRHILGKYWPVALVAAVGCLLLCWPSGERETTESEPAAQTAEREKPDIAGQMPLPWWQKPCSTPGKSLPSPRVAKAALYSSAAVPLAVGTAKTGPSVENPWESR